MIGLPARDRAEKAAARSIVTIVHSRFSINGPTEPLGEPAANPLVSESEPRRINQMSSVPAIGAHGPAVEIRSNAGIETLPPPWLPWRWLAGRQSRLPRRIEGLSCVNMIVPLFPLPGVYLFPGAIVPLHVFEPRYRQMIDDLLDTAGRLVIATPKTTEGGPNSDDPEVFPVAGLGEIQGHRRFEDGRYRIALQGIGRVNITEIESDRLYRQVEARPFEESPVPDEWEPDLHDRLEAAVRDCLSREVEVEIEFPSEVTSYFLTDLLLMQLDIGPEGTQALFCETKVTRRAEGALAAYERERGA